MNVRRILIVDDEASIRESLAEFLRDFNMEVVTSENAEEALGLLATGTKYDLLLADLRLPGMSGDQMILQAHLVQPNLRYLIHTGSLDYRLSSELLAIGLTSDQIMLKPLTDLTSLIDKIEELFKQ